MKALAALQSRNSSLQAENQLLADALLSVFQFMDCEMGWEYFRAEMLYFSDQIKQRQSEQNAEKLRRYLRDQAEKSPKLDALVKEASRRQSR